MINKLLNKLGYYRIGDIDHDGNEICKINYGFSIGRHWMSINDVTFAQSPGDDVWLADHDIHRIIYYTIDQGKHWSIPSLPHHF